MEETLITLGFIGAFILCLIVVNYHFSEESEENNYICIDKEYEGFVVSVKKEFYSNVNGTDYHTYRVILKESEHRVKLYEWSTYWLNYIDYHGNIDKVIKDCISEYKKDLMDKKYIFEKELQFRSQKEKK